MVEKFSNIESLVLLEKSQFSEDPSNLSYRC